MDGGKDGTVDLPSQNQTEIIFRPLCNSSDDCSPSDQYSCGSDGPRDQSQPSADHPALTAAPAQLRRASDRLSL